MYEIEVTTDHTEDDPLDISQWISYTPPEGVNVLTAEVPVEGEPGQVIGWTGAGLTWLDPVKPDPNELKIGTVQSGSTPSATITGDAPSQTLSLTLPKGDKGDRGDTGAPGAIANASSYILTGPGRPDTPATTGGIITGNEPVGAEYRSTDGANAGAWVWMKRPTGWEVTDGDTGWRVFTLAPAPWNGTVSVRVRRIGRTVYMEPHAPSTFGVWRLGSIDATGAGTQIAFTLGDAFRPANRVAAQIVNGGDSGDGERLGRVLVDGTNGQVRVKHPANNTLAMTAMWPTMTPWPTTLPGTAA